ncbi:MAG: hypothetical protein U1F25_15555 [Rubrivivax sp.]
MNEAGGTEGPKAPTVSNAPKAPTVSSAPDAPDAPKVSNAPDAPHAAARAWQWSAAAVLVLTTLVLLWSAVFAALAWMDLAADERRAALALLRPRAGLAFLALLALPGVLWLVVHLWGAAWVRAARRLAEAVSVLASANAAHRITATGPREMRELAQAIDRLAGAHAAPRRDVDARVEAARAERAAETRRGWRR